MTRESLYDSASINTSYVNSSTLNTIAIYRLGNVIEVRLWGTKFSANPAGQPFISNIPNSTIRADNYIHEGGNGAASSLGNIYVTGDGRVYGWCTKTNVAVYGVLVYVTNHYSEN